MRSVLAFTLAAASLAITLPAHAQSSQTTCAEAQTSIEKFLDEREVRSFVRAGLDTISEEMRKEGRQDETCGKMMESAERIFAVERASRERAAAEDMGVSMQPERIAATSTDTAETAVTEQTAEPALKTDTDAKAMTASTSEAAKSGAEKGETPAASGDTKQAESEPAAVEDTKVIETAAARSPSALDGRTVESLIGKEVATAQGDDLGTIDMVVIYKGAPYLIVSHGGFLAIGETEVGVRADKFILSDDSETLMLPGLTEEEFDNMADWDEDDFPEAPEAATIGALYKS